jgi:hypothetical protein
VPLTSIVFVLRKLRHNGTGSLLLLLLFALTVRDDVIELLPGDGLFVSDGDADDIPLDEPSACLRVLFISIHCEQSSHL